MSLPIEKHTDSLGILTVITVLRPPVSRLGRCVVLRPAARRVVETAVRRCVKEDKLMKHAAWTIMAALAWIGVVFGEAAIAQELVPTPVPMSDSVGGGGVLRCRG